MNFTFPSSLISLDLVFYLVGALSLTVAVLGVLDRSNRQRWTTALFWGLLSVPFLLGDAMIALCGKPWTYRILGMSVIALALIAGLNGLGRSSTESSSLTQKRLSAERLGNRLFLPALMIPLITVGLSLLGKYLYVFGLPLLDPKNISLASLAVACVTSLIYGLKMTDCSPYSALQESRRLIDTIGWALILPLMLAMLGGVFVSAQTGQAIQVLVTQWVNPESRLALIVVYGLGMAGLTMIMGNAFAAFPIMAAGIAFPFLIQQHHASPAPLMAFGMLSGYCGTLMTPMAANYNIVPAALLELSDKYGVIRAQIPTALAVLFLNILMMYFLV